jgi:hypothetical protein
VLEINGDLETTGGEGISLVKGRQTRLKAIALSIQPGGHVGQLAISGRLGTHGDDLVTLDAAGSLDSVRIGGGIAAFGARSDAVHATSEIAGLHSVNIDAPHGRQIVSRS